MDHTRVDFILSPPPPEHGIPVDFLDTIRGRSITVAAFTRGQQHPTYHRRLRVWAELPPAPKGGRDLHATRVEVVTEDAWWRNRLLGAAPDRVETFPCAFVWVEEEGAEELPRPLPWPTD